ncbi:hypothetical protein [Streptomyces sp. 1222.5]|uniref:hypothetical protein n=1 Tax=Streptomyces sp. 1222.5 TaxID=1881026 RepID=UPI0015D5D808|nr:hypothetical protein [Streptomyces sp. 1222.5]
MDFTTPADIPVELAGMAWRDAEQPHRTHSAAFAPPVDASIAPYVRWRASAAHNARYDEAASPRAPATPQSVPLEDADIARRVRSMAGHITGSRSVEIRDLRRPA